VEAPCSLLSAVPVSHDQDTILLLQGSYYAESTLTVPHSIHFFAVSTAVLLDINLVSSAQTAIMVKFTNINFVSSSISFDTNADTHFSNCTFSGGANKILMKDAFVSIQGNAVFDGCTFANGYLEGYGGVIRIKRQLSEAALRVSFMKCDFLGSCFSCTNSQQVTYDQCLENRLILNGSRYSQASGAAVFYDDASCNAGNTSLCPSAAIISFLECAFVNNRIEICTTSHFPQTPHRTKPQHPRFSPLRARSASKSFNRLRRRCLHSCRRSCKRYDGILRI
jgi:hypothetical protein